MTITLEQFTDECREILRADAGPAGRRKIAEKLKAALTDKDFVEKHLPLEKGEDSRAVIYEDPEFGFCIRAHVHHDAYAGKPHDHGDSWAIYGQALGETKMTVYNKLQEPNGDRPGLVEAVDSYTMQPGDTAFYDVGDLHAPNWNGLTGLIRIEGRDLDKVRRDAYREKAA